MYTCYSSVDVSLCVYIYIYIFVYMCMGAMWSTHSDPKTLMTRIAADLSLSRARLQATSSCPHVRAAPEAHEGADHALPEAPQVHVR